MHWLMNLYDDSLKVAINFRIILINCIWKLSLVIKNLIVTLVYLSTGPEYKQSIFYFFIKSMQIFKSNYYFILNDEHV